MVHSQDDELFAELSLVAKNSLLKILCLAGVWPGLAEIQLKKFSSAQTGGPPINRPFPNRLQVF